MFLLEKIDESKANLGQLVSDNLPNKTTFKFSITLAVKYISHCDFFFYVLSTRLTPIQPEGKKILLCTCCTYITLHRNPQALPSHAVLQFSLYWHREKFAVGGQRHWSWDACVRTTRLARSSNPAVDIAALRPYRVPTRRDGTPLSPYVKITNWLTPKQSVRIWRKVYTAH